MTNELPHRRKALPLTQSILWVPGDGPPPPGDRYLTFLHQRALNALYEHLHTSPDKGVLGFLLGHLYEDPSNAQRFAVIELVMRLTIAIYGDKTTVVVSRVWDKMQEEMGRSGAQLLGWYHSHPPGGIELAAGDIETHATYFGQTWQSALVMATGPGGASAGLYQPALEGAASGAVLPFYELLDPRSVTPDGKKRSSVRWKNYKPHRPPTGVSTGRSGPVPAIPDPVPATLSFKPSGAPPPPRPAPPKAAPAPPPLPQPTGPLPDMRPPPTIGAEQVPVGFVDKPGAAATTSARRAPPMPPPPPAPPPVPAPPPRRRPSRPAPRFVIDEDKPRSRFWIIAIVLVLVVGGAAGWYFKLGPGAKPGATVAAPSRPSRDSTRPRGGTARPETTQTVAVDIPPVAPPVIETSPPTVPPPAPPPAPAAAPLAALAKFDRIADGLTAAIQSYQERTRVNDCTILGRGLVQVEGQWAAYNAEKKSLSVQLDETRTQRDLSLYASVDTVEAHFDRSPCRRP